MNRTIVSTNALSIRGDWGIKVYRINLSKIGSRYVVEYLVDAQVSLLADTDDVVDAKTQFEFGVNMLNSIREGVL